MDYVPLPRFSSENLALWFAQVESVFALNGITSDDDKYHYVVTQVPLEYSTLVDDILLDPPPESKYDHVKYEFIKRASIFRLKKEELGKNEKPSVYLTRLRNMADARVPIEVILNVWLKNLPLPVREIVSLESSGHVDSIGPMADRAMALLKKSSKQQVPSEEFDTLSERIDELVKEVRTLQVMIDTEGSEGKTKRPPAVPGPSNNDRPASRRPTCCCHSVERYARGNNNSNAAAQD